MKHWLYLLGSTIITSFTLIVLSVLAIAFLSTKAFILGLIFLVYVGYVINPYRLYLKRKVHR